MDPTYTPNSVYYLSKASVFEGLDHPARLCKKKNGQEYVQMSNPRSQLAIYLLQYRDLESP